MVMAKAKQPLIKALVVAIEKYPVIWDKNDPEHKINYQKQLAWGKVHAEMKSKVRIYIQVQAPNSHLLTLLKCQRLARVKLLYYSRPEQVIKRFKNLTQISKRKG